MKRNLKIVDQMIQKTKEQKEESPLSRRQENLLMVIQGLFAQQTAMYKNRSHRIENRIVYLHQPHVRRLCEAKRGQLSSLGRRWPLAWKMAIAGLRSYCGILIRRRERFKKQ